MIHYRLTVGAEDLGTYSTRSEAYLALGEHVMTRAAESSDLFCSIERPRVEAVEATGEPDEVPAFTEDDVRIFGALLDFGRREDEDDDAVTARARALLISMNMDEDGARALVDAYERSRASA